MGKNGCEMVSTLNGREGGYIEYIPESVRVCKYDMLSRKYEMQQSRPAKEETYVKRIYNTS